MINNGNSLPRLRAHLTLCHFLRFGWKINWIQVAATVLLAEGTSPAGAQSDRRETGGLPAVIIAPVNRSASEIAPSPVVSGAGKAEFTKSRPRLILALSGGASKAVAEIGVLRSLERHNIAIDGIVGTSMGSTIGALYCAGMPVDEIERLFVEGKVRKAAVKNIALKVLLGPVTDAVEMFTGRPYAGITSGKAYLKFLAKNLPESFDQLKVPFAAVVTNLTDGRTTVLAKGNLPKSVLASNCIPTIFRPVLIDDKLYVDGGLNANLPSNIARSMGAGIVVAVLVDTALKPVPNQTFKSKTALEARVVDVMLASADKIQTRSSDILIYPDVDFMPAVSKDPEVAKRAIRAGEMAADAVVDKIISDLLATEAGGNSKASSDSSVTTTR
jgi:NTE family protein